MKNKSSNKKKPGEKLNNISPEYDSVREQTVLLEHMNQSIQTIAEQHGSIVEKLDQHSKDLSVIKSELDIVKIATSVMKSDLDTVKMATSVMKSELDIVKIATSVMKSDLDTVKLAIKDVDQKTTRIEQKLDTAIIGHEQRITKLE